jgi:hypothetical protein
VAKLLVADELIEAASRQAGLTSYGSDSFREGLGILLDDFNRCGNADPFVDRMRSAVMMNLGIRLKITDWLARHPQLRQRPIKRPLFVLGVPRTGTTLVSNLLATDPAHRSPLAWELDDPVPPATSATLLNDPRALQRLAEEKAMLAAMPAAGKYYRSSAIYPNECVFIMSNDFKTLMWDSRGRLPNYRDWIFSTDTTSAYEYHQQFLQVLQSEAPGTWNLKMPSHVLNIPTLLKVYPDARLIWTHRDPIAATGSLCSLIALAHRGFMGRVDTDWLRDNYPWQTEQHANRGMDAREQLGAADRVIDVYYADLLRDPVGTMRTVYRALGDEFTPAAEQGMRQWLADNPQDKFGRHEYKLAQFGLTPEAVRARFERYLARFPVEAEG